MPITSLRRATILSEIQLLKGFSAETFALYKYLRLILNIANEISANRYRSNYSDSAYLTECGGTPDESDYTLKHSATRHILAAGGTLATVEVIAAVNGKKICARDIKLGFAPGAGVGVDASCLVYFEDEDGNDVGYCNCTVGSSMSVIEYALPTPASKALHILVGAGPTHCAAGKLSCDVNYWEV